MNLHQKNLMASFFSFLLFFSFVEEMVTFQIQNCSTTKNLNRLKSLKRNLRNCQTMKFHFHLIFWKKCKNLISHVNVGDYINSTVPVLLVTNNIQWTYPLLEFSSFNASLLFKLFSSKEPEFRGWFFDFSLAVSLILRLSVWVLESLWTYFRSFLHSYVQWPYSKHFWHLCVFVSSAVLKQSFCNLLYCF